MRSRNRSYRKKMEEITRDQREEIRKWPGPGDVLGSTDWPCGRVETGNAATDASYVH
jgi:hypothetical protein